MSTPDTAAPTGLLDRLCSIAAAAEQQDPIGSTNITTRLMLTEVPTPWTDIYEGDPEGTVHQRIRAAHLRYIERMRAEDRPFEVMLYGIAPDPEWSDPAQRRVILAARPEAGGEYEMREFLFPIDSVDTAALADAHFFDPARIDEFARYEVAPFAGRELLVCTHGSVDICCARLGIPLYRTARAAYPAVRAWRTVHFGGHRFAPTAWEFPAGYKWAFLDEAAADQVITRSGHPAALRMHVRGWTGVTSPVHLLDRAGLEEHGWDWLRARRSGEVLEADADARVWRTRLAYELPDGRAGAYEGTVEVARDLPNSGCGPTWGEHDSQSPEYALRDLVRLQVTR